MVLSLTRSAFCELGCRVANSSAMWQISEVMGNEIALSSISGVLEVIIVIYLYVSL